RIPAEYEVSIVMLTARGDEADRIVGLELGADDYIPKPFNPRELLARVRAVLRRAAGIVSALEFIPDLPDAVDELIRILAPSGIMVVVIPAHSPLADAGLRLLTGR